MKNDNFKPTLAQRARLLVTSPRLAVSPTIPELTFYGGATITGAHDAVGKEFTIYCARDNKTGKFGLYADADNVPVLFAPVSGRGSVWVSLFDGRAYWKGWEHNSRGGGVLPGFKPFPSIPSLVARIAALEAQLTAQAAAMPPNITGGVLSVPPQGGVEGGEIILAGGDGQADWHIDVYAGHLRIHINGKVAAEWGEP